MKQIILIALLLVVVSVSCDRAPVRTVYGGGSSGSYSNPDRQTTTCVVTQLDPQQKLLFVVAWTAERGGGTSSRSEQNLLTTIHGHPVTPSTSKRALYALQPDHTLREIPLSEPDLKALFDEMQKEGFHTSHSELWQKQVAPNLTKVESPSGG